MAALFEPLGELAGGGGFTGALQAGHEDDGGRLGGELEAGGVLAEEFDELVADDLDDLLGGREGGSTSVPRALARMCSMSSLTTLRLTSASSRATRISLSASCDVLFVEGALAAEVFEGPMQLFCKVLKHRSDSSVSEACGGTPGGEGLPGGPVTPPALPGIVPAFHRDTCRWIVAGAGWDRQSGRPAWSCRRGAVRRFGGR